MFLIRQRGSSIGREVFGGLTTFMAMSYILFVQAGVLSQAGMDANGVIMATCLSAGVASILMGLWANYPIGLAPGMGENFFFLSIAGLLGAMGTGVVGWKMALALVAISGTLFLVLSVVGFRSYVMNSIPRPLQYGIAAGIGLFVITLGLDNGNLIQAGGGLLEFVGFVEASPTNPQAYSPNASALLTLAGLMVMVVLMARRVPGAILIGIVINTGMALLLGMIEWPGQIASMPTGLANTAGGCFEGFAGLWSAILSGRALEVFVFVFVLLFMDLFDTVGTLVGVSNQAGLMRSGILPHADRALAADAVGTMVGATLGSSTVTSYIESATGVSVGARTGLAAIVVGGLFLVAMFFQPAIAMIGGGIEVLPGVFKNPMIAPAMILVGVMMLRSIREISWDDVTDAVPAVLAMVVMPLTMSISHGIAAGFVSYAAAKALTGQSRKCPVIVYVVAALYVLRYLLWAYLRASGTM